MSIEKLDLISDISQLISLYLLLMDKTNSDLMNELQHQNTEYLETIIKNKEEILNLLKNIKNY